MDNDAFVTATQHYDEGTSLLREASHQNLDRDERMIHAARAQAHFLAGVLALVMGEAKPDDATAS